MDTLTKADMATTLYNQLGLSKSEARQTVDLFFQQINQGLISNKPIKLSGFGNFSLRDKKARPGRNPKTGEDAIISARRVVTFKAGQKLKKLIEQQLLD